MKIKSALLTSILLVFTGFVIYYNSSYYITRQMWKFYGGTPKFDFLIFEPGFQLKGWNIYYAQDTKLATQLFCFGNYMMIKLSGSNDIAFYIAKSKARSLELLQIKASGF